MGGSVGASCFVRIAVATALLSACENIACAALPFLAACMADSSSSTSGAAQARALLEQSADAQLTRIQDLEAQRASLSSERKRKTKELKNEMQKRKRLMTKARNLSTDDLLAVVVSRSATAKAKAKARSKMAA